MRKNKYLEMITIYLHICAHGQFIVLIQHIQNIAFNFVNKLITTDKKSTFISIYKITYTPLRKLTLQQVHKTFYFNSFTEINKAPNSFTEFQLPRIASAFDFVASTRQEICGSSFFRLTHWMTSGD